MAFVLCKLMRQLSELSRRRRPSARVEQRSHDLEVPAAGCSRQHRFIIVVGRIGICAPLQEKVDNGEMPVAGCSHEGRTKFAFVGLICFGAVVEQQANDSLVAERGSPVQRRFIRVVELIHAGPGLQESTDFG